MSNRTSRAPVPNPEVRPLAALVMLTALHFMVDFYGGLLTPLPQPTLTSHLGADIGKIALLLGGWALVTNVVQPLFGWLLPRRGLPLVLLLAPPAAAASTLIGLTASVPSAAVLLFVSGIGIGVIHPEATLAVQSLGGRHAGAAVGLFMAAGYFGFAFGGVVGGVWAELRGLEGFWLMFLPALLIVALAARFRLHRLEGHVLEHEPPPARPVRFPVVFCLATGTAVALLMLVRFYTILLVRRFPEAAGQGWGGATIFATGIAGAGGAFLWGHVADRAGAARVLIWLNLAALPFYAALLKVHQAAWAPLLGLGVGLTLGSAFPLVVVLARQTRGFSQRLRMGWIIGGAWGLGEAVFMAGGQYLKRFAETDPAPVEGLLRGGLALLCVNGLLAWRAARARCSGAGNIP